MNLNKTLIGLNNYLFLINDSSRELEVHCNNLNLVNNKNLKRYNLDNFLLIIFPNKSIVYKNYLPNNYNAKFRPGLEEYIKYFGNKIIDTYDILKHESNTYYKTDTHINIKGSYIVYRHFIKKVNEIYNLNIKPKEIKLLCKECVLTELKYGIGDLLWKSNLGDQKVDSNIDTFYYSDDISFLYYNHVINKNDEIRILNTDLNDINEDLQGSLISWEILSNNILYKKNNFVDKTKILIFYDSFLIPLLELYLEMFGEVYMIKKQYDKKFIDMINPDYVFEFRVERFLV